MNPPFSLKELHRELLSGNPLAPSMIADRLFVPTCEALQRKYPGNRFEYLVNQAVADALVSYLQQPEQFDPSKGELASYMRMAALGDLKNALRSEGKVQEKLLPDVELSLLAGKEEEGEDVLSRLRVEELREAIRGLFPEERDWQIVELMIEQERQTERFAEILGLQHRPLEEQRLEVKRHKDRIKQKLRRYGDSIRERPEQG